MLASRNQSPEKFTSEDLRKGGKNVTTNFDATCSQTKGFN
jgi:hypothetical protein